MKKSVFLLVVLLFAAGITAQAQFKYGLKAGVNFSDLSFSGTASELYNNNAENAVGFQAGPMLEFTVPIIGIGLDAALLYSQTGFKMKDYTDATGIEIEGETNTSSNLLIPVNLKYKLSLLDIVGAYVAAGPYAQFKLKNLGDQYKNKTFAAGLNFGLGVELLGHLQVGVNYQLGLTDDFSSKKEVAGVSVIDFNAKTSVWTVSAAYFF